MKRLMIVIAFALCAPAQADVLQMPETRSEALTPDRGSLPQRGESMDSVNAKYGPPLGVSGPVGKPPITRWNYDGFSVFFEYEHVINAVIIGKPAPIYNQDELRPSEPR